jgi:hypothetical protein
LYLPFPSFPLLQSFFLPLHVSPHKAPAGRFAACFRSPRAVAVEDLEEF